MLCRLLNEITLTAEEGNERIKSKEKGNYWSQDDNIKREGKIMETKCEEDKIENMQDEEESKSVERVNKSLKIHHNEQAVLHSILGDTEPMKHVTYNENVQVFQVNSINNEEMVFDEQITPINETNSRKYTGGPNISDPNFKRKVTFSNEIIVIAYDHEDMGHTFDYNYDDQDVEDLTEVEDIPYRGVFGHCSETKQEEVTVNYAEAVSNKNIFKAVSFSNEVTVIDDGNLVFTTTMKECPDNIETPTERLNSRVDKLLSKLKKVVKKLEEKNAHGQGSSRRDKKVLGDAEQDRSLHQVEIVKVDGMNEKEVVFSDQIENATMEAREPNLRKVTFSKEIIVIAYPTDDYDNMNDEDNVYNPDQEIEQSSMNYAVPSSKNICKTVSFSNEVTVIHDRNLMFSDSTESIKDSSETRKKMDTEEGLEESDQ